MTARKVKETPAIPFSGLIKGGPKSGWDGVPDGPNPFYLGYKDGLFLHRRNLLGRGIARMDNWPNEFTEFGSSIGSFWWEADPIPAKLMGQTVSFFERIYDKQHTEAMVLLVMNQDTREWRIFIPTQMVSHGGVNYVFDPSHIKLPWVLVGSIHSHCDFGAGHSGTDTHDAEGFDGFHATIGYIKRPVPQIVAMVAMNKRLMHYKEDLFPKLFDFTETKEHEAPAWWDRYVEDTKAKTNPKGFELFKKFGKPSVTAKTKITPATPHNYAPPVQRSNLTQDWSWSNAAQRMVHKSWTVAADGSVTLPETNTVIRRQSTGFQPPAIRNISPNQKPLGADKDDWTEFYRLQGLDGAPKGYEQFSPQTLLEAGYVWDAKERSWEWVGRGNEDVPGLSRESREFNARQVAARGSASWGVEGELLAGATEEDLREMGLWGLTNDGPNWEDELPQNVRDALYDSELLTEEDIDHAQRNPLLGSDPDYWREVMMYKVFRATATLREMGVSVSIGVKAIEPKSSTLLLPDGQEHKIESVAIERNN